MPDDNDTFLLTCDDLPEVTTFGEDRDDALMRGRDAISEALAARMAHREDIPVPTGGSGDLIAVPTADALKAKVYQALRESGVRRAELARRLQQHPPQIDRLFDLKHASKVEQLDAALRAVGKRLVFEIEPLDEAA
ncbi:MAG TPA: type II toxin-antitoxin system HicB family antitoxin [Alphaproteobacteria bacterium]|nr:type II toxin-antitoxin system HicB family antitoxin [Alphaproteobacteria bacterium]